MSQIALWLLFMASGLFAPTQQDGGYPGDYTIEPPQAETQYEWRGAVLPGTTKGGGK